MHPFNFNSYIKNVVISFKRRTDKMHDYDFCLKLKNGHGRLIFTSNIKITWSTFNLFLNKNGTLRRDE